MVPASSARNLLVLSLMACSEAFRATLLFVAPGKLVLLPQLRADTPTAADSAPRLCLSLPPITRRHCAPLSAQRYPCPYADCDAVEPAAGHKIWGAVELWDLPPLSAGLLTAWLDWEWEPGALGRARSRAAAAGGRGGGQWQPDVEPSALLVAVPPPLRSRYATRGARRSGLAGALPSAPHPVSPPWPVPGPLLSDAALCSLCRWHYQMEYCTQEGSQVAATTAGASGATAVAMAAAVAAAVALTAENAADVESGDLVCLAQHHSTINDFFRVIVHGALRPGVRVRLLSLEFDNALPPLAPLPRAVAHWWGWNNLAPLTSGSRQHGVPLGISHRKTNDLLLQQMALNGGGRGPRRDRLLLVNFAIDTNPAERLGLWQLALRRWPFADVLRTVGRGGGGCPRQQQRTAGTLDGCVSGGFYAELSRYRFVASPAGVNADCHRTWEALLCGAIPIVRRGSHMDAHYEGLPVLLVGEWEEVTEELLHATLRAFGARRQEAQERRAGPAAFAWERLFLPYWKAQLAAPDEDIRTSTSS